MQANELKAKFLAFFKNKQHSILDSAPLIPENDPTVLFTNAGMHPLVQYLGGQKHPKGTRLASIQKCMRTQDIDEVGDATHTTFFEMAGNWSLGDYFKQEAITWSFEFLTQELKIQKERLAVSVFKGDNDAPKDTESADIWKKLGISEDRIAYLGKKDNWWGPVGESGPCGPDTEMFYWVPDSPAPTTFDPEDENWVEIWNDVFMEYTKKKRTTLLIDGMHCLYDDTFKVNTKIAKILQESNLTCILTVNGKKKQGLESCKKFVQSGFSLEDQGFKKHDTEYFEKLLRQYKLQPDEIIYIDHKEEHVQTARNLGISAEQYANPKQIEKWIQQNKNYFAPLKQKAVDTGMGVERVTMLMQGKRTVFDTELFQPIFAKLNELAKKKMNADTATSYRIMADHLRASVFILGDERGVAPSNVDQGYILRRYIRRCIRHGKTLGMPSQFCLPVAKIIIDMYKKEYPLLTEKTQFILEELTKEEEKFEKTLEKGLREFAKMAAKGDISGTDAFLLFQSYGFPLEMTEEMADEQSIQVDVESFFTEYEQHKSTSRIGAEKKFKGGLADLSVETTRLHTATHLLNEALRKVISKDIRQRGSNITPERLRFDFSFERKLTAEEKQAVEDEVNRVINANMKVTRKEIPLKEAEKLGAQKEFGQKYPDMVSVYFVGEYSKEFCGGPHVENTKEIGHFRIVKEQSSAAGIRRIKAVVEDEPRS